MKRPLLESVQRYPPETASSEGKTLHPYKQPLKGSVISSVPQYRRIGAITVTVDASGVSVSSPSGIEWRNRFCMDARELAMRCILHACGESCWKYSKPGMPPTCRHGMFHVIISESHDVKGRRSGKKLRNAVQIIMEDEGGMLGRVCTFQEHPYEGPTSYTGLVNVRCNLDLQDLRRVLVKYAPEVMPCIGDRPEWAWMNNGGVPCELPVPAFPKEDVMLCLAVLEQKHGVQKLTTSPADQDLAKMLLLMFMDTHNTGFYVNSYTTKMGVGMAEFMKHFREGIERLHKQLAEEEAQMARDRKALGAGPKSLGIAKRAAKTLLRINTAYTKCKHVGGSELVFPIIFGHLCYQTHSCWNVWTKAAVWRALESWRRSIKSIHAVAANDVVEPDQMVHADRGKLAYLPKEWRPFGQDKVQGPDGTIYASVALAQEAYLATNAMEKQLESHEVKSLAEFMHSADNALETLEVDGVVVTTNQLDDYNHRGNHPVLAPMTLYVYSMWVYRAEKKDGNENACELTFDFHPGYKLASGYTQRLSVTERVPKIDGYTMPPPRAGGSGSISDVELNAMVKSVLHRPTRLTNISESLVGDPLECYAELHAQPAEAMPNYPWSPTTAFSGAWYSYFADVNEKARRASRKLLARQEMETLWETQEVETALCKVLDMEVPQVHRKTGEELDDSKLTCEEYVAYITVEVVGNMDAIAWARVNRKTRMPELYQHLQILGGGERDAASADVDADVQQLMATPGLLRRIPFPAESLKVAFEYIEALGERSTQYAKELKEFFTTQRMTLFHEGTQDKDRTTQAKWKARAGALARLHAAFDGLRVACREPDFVGNCVTEQTRAIKGTGHEVEIDEHNVILANDAEEASGEVARSLETILPVGWIEPVANSLTPSQYITKLLAEVERKYYPTLEQLRFLAVLASVLDTVKEEEDQQMQWPLRTQKVLMLLGQGGCGKTFIVQQYVARVVAYAFGTDEAIRMIAFSNPQATNLSSDRFPAYTVHRASQMRVQNLVNSAMNAGAKLAELENFWNPARVMVAEEITMWPAAVYNMGLLRSAWGRLAQCDLDMDEYRLRGKLWGRMPLVAMSLTDIVCAEPALHACVRCRRIIN